MWTDGYAVIEKSGSKMVIAAKEEDRSLCKLMIARVLAVGYIVFSKPEIIQRDSSCGETITLTVRRVL